MIKRIELQSFKLGECSYCGNPIRSNQGFDMYLHNECADLISEHNRFVNACEEAYTSEKKAKVKRIYFKHKNYSSNLFAGSRRSS